MPEPMENFRQQLLSAQETSPALREAYQKELATMLQPPMTVRSAFPGVVLLVLLLGCTAGIVRAMIFYPPGAMMLSAYAILAVAFTAASVFIVRDIVKRKHSHVSVSSIANLLTGAAGTVTVIALILGLRTSSDPKTLFGAFYVFVFYFACAVWSLQCRIAAAELSASEQSLRMEYRLADLAERLKK